ncbi:MAG: OmpH family outer membrane protein [Bacteroidales bacterium]|jgi:outer membrane protein|nr:OmpH family outer membrane protein [Bacteroidales bacterium]MBQ1905244.1 OmpH family outer membrane protein [Bacteroidales bacterium]MBQ2103667.1 OmpH family outer membrane protein [Bacteroidales bacterium]MBQ2501418.1 OmpH family outer membrane protein [Bacteroidales bacterium]MBQ3976899.1 OmpH family outer membrane protein [Bacteroidales bacterium]
MKKTPLILSIIALAGVIALAVLQFASSSKAKAPVVAETDASGPQKGAIVYFNLDRVLNEYDMANDLSSVVQTKIQSISEELNRRQNRLQSDANSFQEKINKGLLTSSVAEVQYQKLQQQDQEFQQYAAQKQQEMDEEQSVMINQIADAINTYLQKYNEVKQYAMIVSTQGNILSAPIASGDAALDITDELIAGLNEDYIKTKNAK